MRKRGERRVDVVGTAGERGEDADPGGQVRVDERVTELKRGLRPGLAREHRQRPSRGGGNARRDPAGQADRRSREPLDPADLREVVQDREVFDFVLLRKTSDARVGGCRDREARPHPLVRVRRPRPCQAERVVAERDLVEAAGSREVLVPGETVLEKIDRGRGGGRVQAGDLLEVVGGQDRIGIRRVDPGGAKPTPRVKAKEEVASDFPREADALSRRQEPTGSGAIDDEQAAVGMIMKTSRRILRQRSARTEDAADLFQRQTVGFENLGRRVAAGVDDHGREHGSDRPGRDGRERLEKAFFLAIRRDLDRVTEIFDDRIRQDRFRLRGVRKILRDGRLHRRRGSAAADRGQNRDLAVVRDRGGQPLAEADALRTHEEVHVRTDLAALVQDPSRDARVFRAERVERLGERSGRDLEIDPRTALREISQRAGHEEMDRHQAAFFRRRRSAPPGFAAGTRACAFARACTVAARTNVTAGRSSATSDQLSPSSREAYSRPSRVPK